MNTFTIFEQKAPENKPAQLLIETQAYEGIKRIGARVACDIGLVAGVEPALITAPNQCENDRVVIFATLGKSPFLEMLEASGRWSGAQIQGKREVYQIQVVSAPFPQMPSVKEALVIAGSDKRGTIYGMFRLSELCGVSPLVYWGDVSPEKKDTVRVSVGDGILSKEPSVKYRGFFINDEWPAFGNWCMETFGGVNAKHMRRFLSCCCVSKAIICGLPCGTLSFRRRDRGLRVLSLRTCTALSWVPRTTSRSAAPGRNGSGFTKNTARTTRGVFCQTRRPSQNFGRTASCETSRMKM